MVGYVNVVPALNKSPTTPMTSTPSLTTENPTTPATTITNNRKPPISPTPLANSLKPKTTPTTPASPSSPRHKHLPDPASNIRQVTTCQPRTTIEIFVRYLLILLAIFVRFHHIILAIPHSTFQKSSA